MKTPSRERAGAERLHVYEGVMKAFGVYNRRYLRRHFHAVRILQNRLPQRQSGRPLVIYFNHASWWDPLVCLLLAREFYPSRTSFGPIDAAMLKRYGFFKHLGFFPVEQKSPRTALQFLRATHAILASPRHAVWLAPQGRFMDVRERPLRLQEGLGALATREIQASFVPLAIEYAFWTEPRPEILVSFGAPVDPSTEPERTAAEWTSTFGGSLEAAEDELAAHSCRRDATEWVTLNRGKSGVNAIYDSWRWLRGRIRGETFVPEHPAEASR